MSLQNLLDLSSSRNKKIGISEERVRAIMPEIRNSIAFYREYPDLFVDFIKGPDSNFKFYFYQRIFLRVVMRHRKVYATFPRAYSKSFLSMMVLMLRCILYPGCELFITTGGKEQAASITVAKIDEICRLIPSLNNEINWDRGVSKKSKDNVEYVFKNGSKINILAARESSRGQRRTGGLMEECVLIDQNALNEIIIPTTNVDRRLPDGSRHPEEVVNKSQIYITTAGYKNSFAYEKLIELLVESVLEPDKTMIMGGTWETPVTEGLLNEDFVEELKMSGTFNEASFEREYCSVWSGDAENAYFSSDIFEKHRQLLQPEYEFSGRSSKTAYYVLGIDVGRKGCTSEVMVIKVTPQVQGAAIKTLVNLYSYEEEHFEDQAIKIKKLFFKYKARVCAIDANGLGIGLVDYMVKTQVDPETGDTLPPFGVENDDDGFYKKYRTDETVRDAMFLIKANAPINTEAHSYVQTQLSSGKIKFLIDEREAKVKLMSTKMGQEMSPDERAEKLMPFTLTTVLKDQMMNLVEDNEGVNIILKQNNRGIKKDKFSAFEYGLYYIKLDEERKRKRKSYNIADLMFMN
jgi:hypothetical protein